VGSCTNLVPAKRCGRAPLPGSGPVPDPVREVDRCEGSLPSSPSPWRPYTNEGDHGAICTSGFSGYQVDGCVGDDYPAVFAQGRDLEKRAVQSTALHCLVESPPMQGPEDGRDHHIETAPQRVGCRMTHDVRDRITPLMDYPITVDGHGGAAVLGRLGSVHTVLTTGTVAGFTDARIRALGSKRRPWRAARRRQKSDPGWDRTSDLPRVKLKRCQKRDRSAGRAVRTGSSLRIQSARSQRHGGCRADEIGPRPRFGVRSVGANARVQNSWTVQRIS
jgi:hypothetical protein